MVKKRAIAADEVRAEVDKLPMLYSALMPLTHERHGQLHLHRTTDFRFAAEVNAVPLTCDEFPRAMRDYPIVIAGGAAPLPVALVGLRRNRNDYVDETGAWAEGAYIPAYLRRYPFALLRQTNGSEKGILCADLTSPLFTERAEESARPLFDGAEPAERLKEVLEFATNYERALARTRAVMETASKHDLIAPAAVTVKRGDQNAKLEGFSMVAEERVRQLPDKTLADLARRGVLNIFAAHQLSMSNFGEFGAT